MEKRLSDHQIHTLYAVQGFAAHAQELIATLESGDADFDPTPLVSALDTAMKLVFPASQTVGTLTSILSLDNAMVGAFHSHWHPSRSGAQDKLNAAVGALVESFTEKADAAWVDSKQNLANLIEDILPDLDDQSMTVRPEFIGYACDYYGIRDANDTYNTVRQQLELEFVSIHERVRVELQNAHLGAEQHSPDSAGSWAWQEEQRLYRKEGSEAWEDIYKE